MEGKKGLGRVEEREGLEGMGVKRKGGEGRREGWEERGGKGIF